MKTLFSGNGRRLGGFGNAGYLMRNKGGVLVKRAEMEQMECALKILNEEFLGKGRKGRFQMRLENNWKEGEMRHWTFLDDSIVRVKK